MLITRRVSFYLRQCDEQKQKFHQNKKCVTISDKDKKNEKMKDIINKIFTLIVTIMTLVAAIVPIVMLSSGTPTTVDTTSSTSNMPTTIGTYQVPIK